MRSDKIRPAVDPKADKPMMGRCNMEWPGPCAARSSKLATFPHTCRMVKGHAKSPNTRHQCWCASQHMNRRKK